VSNAGIVVERAGGALVVRAAAADAEGAAYVAGLSAEPGRTAVLVDRSATAALERLDQLLVAEMHRQLAWLAPAGGVRLLADRAAAAGPHGTPPAALRLARSLGVRVIAPDGPLVALRGGELFSAGPAAGWTEFGPDRAARRNGPRYPEPAWQRQLPPRLGDRVPVDLTAVPAGMWLRAPGAPAPSTSDWAYGVPPQPQRLAVLLGAPGESHVDGAAAAAVLAQLPAAVLAAVVLVLYGPQPAGPPVGQWLADRLGVPIQVCHALPHYRVDGSTGVTAVDADGQLTWAPLALESTYRPGAASPDPRAWLPPAADLRPAGPATFWLDPDWLVDVVPSGLSIRPATAAPSAAVAALPVDPHWISVAVTADPPESLRPAIDRLVTLLPADVRTRLLTVGSPSPAQLELARANRLAVHTLPAPAPSAARAREVDPPTEVIAAPASLPPVAAQAAPTAAPAAAPAAVPSQPAPRPGGPDRPSATPAAASLADLSRSTLHAVPTGRSALPVPPSRTAPRPGPTPARTAAAEAATAQPAPRPAFQAARPPQPVLPAAQPAGPPQPVLPAAQVTQPAAPPAPAPARPAAAQLTAAQPTAAQPTAQPAAQPAAQAAPTSAGPAVTPAPAAWTELPVRAETAAPVAPPPPAGQPAPVAEVMSGPVAVAASTERDRLSFRLSLGWRYDAAVRSVARLLAERPGLRMAGADDTVLAELAAVRVFASSEQVGTVAAMRAGTATADAAYHACLYGGLRRLPVLRGVVVRGGPADPSTVDAYRPGQVLLDPAPLVAAADPLTPVPGTVELLIWSRTARRLDGLVDGPRGAEVVFAPGTALTVLAVEPPGAGPRRVLLAEDAPADPDRLARVRDRLATAAAGRDAAATAAREARDGAVGRAAPAADARFDVLPGLVRRAAA
jgi:hypothetical protein